MRVLSCQNLYIFVQSCLGHTISCHAIHFFRSLLNKCVKFFPSDFLRAQKLFSLCITSRNKLWSCNSSYCHYAAIVLNQWNEGITHELWPIKVCFYHLVFITVWLDYTASIVDETIELFHPKSILNLSSCIYHGCLICHIDFDQLDFTFSLCIFLNYLLDRSGSFV